MTAVLIIALVALAILAALAVGYVLAWIETKDGPWNWRILVWPGLYYRWLEVDERRSRR